MFCVQCEQTIRTPAGNGCSYAQGMCGKTAETSDLQDLLVAVLQGLSAWALTARELGLRAEVVIAGGGGDNPVAAVGIGAINAGDGFITLGTSAAIVAITDHAAGNPATAVHSFCHALPERWYTMGAMLAGASCLRWVTRLTGMPDEQALLDQVQAQLPIGQSVPLSTPLFLYFQ